MNGKETWHDESCTRFEVCCESESFLTPEEISIFSIYCSQVPVYLKQSVSEVFGTPSVCVEVNDGQSETPEVVSSKKVIYCEKCHKNFASRNRLENHKCLDKCKQEFKCEICGKIFFALGNYKRHIAMHSGEKPFKCPECDKTFTTNGHLTDHYRKHSGDRPFKCFCGKSFRRGHTLKKHKYVHTGEKPIKCEECGKGFTDSGNLKIHQRTHTDERPFTCVFPDCGKSFRTKAHLKEHLTIKIHFNSNSNGSESRYMLAFFQLQEII